MNGTYLRTAGLAAGDVAVLVALPPRWGTVAAGLAHPATWLAAGPDQAVAAASGALLWLAAAWLALGLVAGLGTRLPGAAGRACARCARLVVPRVLLRVVLGSTGLGLLAVPAAHAAAPGGERPPPITRVSAAPAAASWLAASTWVPDRGSRAAVPSPTVPSPTWPVAPAAHATRAVPAPTPPTSDGPTVRVQPGDSLWLLAARRLGPHAGAAAVAHYWPQVYAANRSVIGDDPSVIHPGQVLDLPAPSTQEAR